MKTKNKDLNKQLAQFENELFDLGQKHMKKMEQFKLEKAENKKLKNKFTKESKKNQLKSKKVKKINKLLKLAKHDYKCVEIGVKKKMEEYHLQNNKIIEKINEWIGQKEEELESEFLEVESQRINEKKAYKILESKAQEALKQINEIGQKQNDLKRKIEKKSLSLKEKLNTKSNF